MERMTIELTEDFDGLSMREVLQRWLVPRKTRYELLTEGGLSRDGVVLAADSRVHAGEEIVVRWGADDGEGFPESGRRDRRPVEVLYEDEALIIVNKPERLKTHANAPGEIGLRELVAQQLGRDVYVVHRLDAATSGCVLFAKNRLTLPILSEMLAAREIHRTYTALVSGLVAADEMTIDKAIGRDRHDSRRYRLSRSGKRAVTHVSTLSRGKQISLVSCQLETGRTHQIRVHLSADGHPILGDALYGGKPCSRLMLHATALSLRQPFSRQEIAVTADSQSFTSELNRAKGLM